jgi:hypothetical protein
VSNVRWNNYAIDKGFLQIPNLLIDYHEELGIDEKELLFLIKLSRHKSSFKVHDDKLVKGCQKTAQRRRSSLKKKGLLLFHEHKESYIEEGKTKWNTVGFTYDLSILNEKLQELNNQLNDDFVSNEDKNVVENDENGDEDRHQRPPNNTSNNTNYNTSSSTTTNFKKTSALDLELDASKFKDIIDAYKLNIDASYIVQKKDLLSLRRFAYPERLEKYIPYWSKFIGTHGEYLYNANRLDAFDKKHTAQIHVMIKHWNNFYKFAERKIKSAEDYKQAFG